MTFFDLAVEHDPALARAWFFRGLALNGLGRFDEALKCLDRVVALEPRDPNAWVEKGRALTRSGQREEALACFDRAIAINPWHLAALYEKGVCLLFLGRFEEAAACIGEVAAIRPGPAVEAARQACLAGLPSTDKARRASSGRSWSRSTTWTCGRDRADHRGGPGLEGRGAGGAARPGGGHRPGPPAHRAAQPGQAAGAVGRAGAGATRGRPAEHDRLGEILNAVWVGRGDAPP